jgi:hypothetical protein
VRCGTARLASLYIAFVPSSSFCIAAAQLLLDEDEDDKPDKNKKEESDDDAEPIVPCSASEKEGNVDKGQQKYGGVDNDNQTSAFAAPQAGDTAIVS